LLTYISKFKVFTIIFVKSIMIEQENLNFKFSWLPHTCVLNEYENEIGRRHSNLLNYDIYKSNASIISTIYIHFTTSAHNNNILTKF